MGRREPDDRTPTTEPTPAVALSAAGRLWPAAWPSRGYHPAAVAGWATPSGWATPCLSATAAVRCARASPSTGPPAAAGPEAARSIRDRGAMVAGIVVVGIGVFLLLGQLVPDTGTWNPLIVGLVFLAAALFRREYGFLVPGGIISGVGVGVLLEPAFDEPWAGAILLFSIAAGFASIWVLGQLMRMPENHPWPLIPASIIALVAGVQLADADVDGVMRWWPLIIIAFGVVIIESALLRRRR